MSSSFFGTLSWDVLIMRKVLLVRSGLLFEETHSEMNFAVFRPKFRRTVEKAGMVKSLIFFLSPWPKLLGIYTSRDFQTDSDSYRRYSETDRRTWTFFSQTKITHWWTLTPHGLFWPVARRDGIAFRHRTIYGMQWLKMHPSEMKGQWIRQKWTEKWMESAREAAGYASLGRWPWILACTHVSQRNMQA